MVMDKIYLVGTSPQNEDFILDGYAVDEDGIRQLINNYCREVYDDAVGKILIKGLFARAEIPLMTIDFYIRCIPKVSVIG